MFFRRRAEEAKRMSSSSAVRIILGTKRLAPSVATDDVAEVIIFDKNGSKTFLVYSPTV